MMKRHACVLLLCCSLPCRAETATEEDIRRAPMPHQTRAAGAAAVKVHFASVSSYLEGTFGNAGALAKLHDEVAQCIAHHGHDGAPLRPPSRWPDYVSSHRHDRYHAANRSITYSDGVIYRVDMRDCSLAELRTRTARLVSLLGSCDIDFDRKTARGRCDADGHAHARVLARPPLPTAAETAAAERAAATHPGLAAQLAVMRRYAPESRGRKTILGLECDIMPAPLNAGGEACMSRGGSFVASTVAGPEVHSRLLLESTSEHGLIMHATRAQLDALVHPAVFTPYVGGGFRLLRAGEQP